MSIDEQIRPFTDVDLDAFTGMFGAERDAELVRVAKEIRRLTAVQASMIHAVATSGSFTDDAHHTPQAWVQAVLNTSRSTAMELVRTAALFAEVPALASAVSSGRVGADQVRELTRVYANPRCRSLLAEHGPALVEPAAGLVFDDFRKTVARWSAYADPDGTHRDHETSRANRHVRTSTLGHGGIIHAEGDAASIEEMTDILRAHAESEFLKDCEERALKYGADADLHPLRRTVGQRYFDAFQEIFRKAAGTSIPGVSDPTVNIITTEADLADAVRNHFGQPSLGKSDRQRLCETEHGSPVDPNDMVVAALLGKIRSVIVTDDGRYLRSSSKQRLFTGAMRDTILMLGGHHCNRPGCNTSGPNVQIDHIEAWICNGCTTALNGGPMCPLHNRDKHRLGFTVTHDHNGWHHHRPDGTEIAPEAAKRAAVAARMVSVGGGGRRANRARP